MSGLKDVIDYKYKIINEIANSNTIMGLIFNDPNIDMESDLVTNVRDDNIVDHSFTDDTYTQDRTAIFVECKMLELPSATIKNMGVYIQIISNNGYIKLNRQNFKGIKGNRNDNIAVEIAELIDGFDCGAIGELALEECAPITAPNGFSSLQLSFTTANFR